MSRFQLWLRRAAIMAAAAMPLSVYAEEPAAAGATNPLVKDAPAAKRDAAAEKPETAAEKPAGRIPRAPKPEARSKGRAVDPKEMIKRMMREDVNEDGILEKSEFHGPEKQFERADANGDGKLDAKEIEASAFAMASRRGPMGDAMAPGRPDPAGLIEALDKNRDGKIAREEAGKRLAENFDKLDKNADGSIEKEELASAMARGGRGDRGDRPGRPGPEGGPPSAEEMMEHMDEDLSGKIEKAEARGPFAEHFDEIDADQNGEASMEELKAFRGKMEEMGPPPRGERGERGEGGDRPDMPRRGKRGDRRGRERAPDHATMMKKMDANNDGFLQPSELPAMKEGKPGKGKEDAFDKLDVDGDGKISPEEFKAYKGPREAGGKKGKKAPKKGEAPAATPENPSAEKPGA